MSILMALAMQAASAGAAQDCQAAIGPLYDGPELSSLPHQVNGATISGAEGLARLRRERGDAPIILNGGSFARADLRRVPLRNICFNGTDLSGSDLRGADAVGTAFVSANLEGANLAGARLTRVLLRQPDLKNADATGADLSGGRMDGGWDGSVENLRLDRANLSGFSFDCGLTIGDGCPVHGDMRLTGANLTGASLATYSRYADWTGARIDGTELSLQQLLDLSGADLQGPLRIRGGDTLVELSPADYRALRPYIASPSAERRPSFDCAAAATPAEREICGETGDRLRALGADVAALYQRVRTADPAAAAAQQAWLRTRNRCGADESCLHDSYNARMGQLLGRLGAPGWARPGTAALFIQPDLVFAPAFRDQPLYRRLLPVIIDGASARIVLRVNADGSLDAGGDAIGGNAHLCSLWGERLRFDPANGWYSGPYEDNAETPPALRGRPMPVLRFLDDRAEVYRYGHGGYGDSGPDPRPSDYASCGARAGFTELVRVPVTPAEAEGLLQSYRDNQ